MTFEPPSELGCEVNFMGAAFGVSVIITSGKNHFHEMNGDVGMAG